MPRPTPLTLARHPDALVRARVGPAAAKARRS